MLCLPYQFRVICHKEFCCSFGYRIEKYKVSIINELQRGMHFKKKAIRSSLWKKSDTCHIWENKFCLNLNCLNEPIIELRRKIQLSHFKEKKNPLMTFPTTTLHLEYSWSIPKVIFRILFCENLEDGWTWIIITKKYIGAEDPPPAPTFLMPLFWNICWGIVYVL